MRIGELVWVRNGPQTPTWGIVINELVVYLTDNAVMVSYEVLVDSVVWPCDVGDVLRFYYYNRHLNNDDKLSANDGGPSLYSR